MIEHKIHPTPLFIDEYNDSNDLAYAANYVRELERNNQSRTLYSSTGFTSYGLNHDILSNFNNIKQFIDDKVKEANYSSRICGETEYAMSWASINRKYSVHGKHNHLPFTWSGVLYLQADNTDADIQFYNTNLNSAWPYAPFKQNNMFSFIGLSPSTGKLIIFPSYLEHEVIEQTYEKERITISFNYNLIPE